MGSPRRHCIRGEPLPLDTGVLRPVIEWICSISYELWPQQTRLPDGLLRPSMVSDLTWNSFGEVTNELVMAASPGAEFRERNRLLSVVMPGANIVPHTDELGPDWSTRIHIPLLTNPDAMFITDTAVRHLEVGFAYEINTRERHAVWNAGSVPRVHLMFDLHL